MRKVSALTFDTLAPNFFYLGNDNASEAVNYASHASDFFHFFTGPLVGVGGAVLLKNGGLL